MSETEPLINVIMLLLCETTPLPTAMTPPRRPNSRSAPKSAKRHSIGQRRVATMRLTTVRTLMMIGTREHAAERRRSVIATAHVSTGSRAVGPTESQTAWRADLVADYEIDAEEQEDPQEPDEEPHEHR